MRPRALRGAVGERPRHGPAAAALKRRAEMNASGRLPAGGEEEPPSAALLPLGGNGSAAAGLREGTHTATLAACASLLALVFWYPLTKKRVDENVAILEERHAAAAASASEQA